MNKDRSSKEDSKPRTTRRTVRSRELFHQTRPSEEIPFTDDSHLSRISMIVPPSSRLSMSPQFSDVIEWNKEDLNESLSFCYPDQFQKDARRIAAALEQTQMKVEDLQGLLLRSEQKELFAILRSNIDYLQQTGSSQLSLGKLRIRVRLIRPPPSSTLETQLLRDQAGLRTPRLPRISENLAMIEAKQEDLRKAVAQQATERRSLKESIERLLEKTELGNDTTPRMMTEEDLESRCEMELGMVRREVDALRNDGLKVGSVQKEMDFAEDLLVRVRYGEDKKQFLAQLEIVKSAIIQSKALKVISETEKITSALDTSLRVFEKDRSLTKSKASIMKKVLGRIISAESTVEPSPNGSFDMFKRPLISIKSSLESCDGRNFLSDRLRTGEGENPYKEMATAWQKRAIDLQERLARYISFEDSLTLEKGKLKAGMHELQLRKTTLDTREQALFQQEVGLALMEDRFRAIVSRALTPADSQEYLKERCVELAEERLSLEKDRFTLEIQWEKQKRREFEFTEHRKVLDRKLRKVTRDQKKVMEMKDRVKAVQKELKLFLPQLQASSA